MFKRLELSEFNELIKKHSLTKKEISIRIGMTENGMHEALTERQSLKLTTFQDICEVMQIHPSSLFLAPGQNIDDIPMVQEEKAVYRRLSDVKPTSESVPRILYTEMKNRYEDEIQYLRGLVSKTGE